MKNYLKRLSRTQWTIILFAILSLGFYYYFSTDTLPTQKETVTVNEQKTEEGETVLKIQDKDSEEIAREFHLNMSEEDVRMAIHQMSHQKIVADKRWGAIPLTPERVNRLIEVVNDNHTKYASSDVYMDILNRWSEGDFSEVDEDHNKIWTLQRGTVGKAEGIASSKEEREFIEKHFKVDQ